MVLRDEAAYLCGRGDGHEPMPEHDGGEHARRDRGHRLLRGDEREAWGDAGYQGFEPCLELAESAVE